ncbi:MAG: hypothetical protein M1818_001434 [Claussenomyces sp. TS43310]|nr:MAG: hypothetical protein M1818_001434 [Claussenomyces sp. TS43310]
MPLNYPDHPKRKKQTRLTFDPVESSPLTMMSPARILYSTPSSCTRPLESSSPIHSHGRNSSSGTPSNKLSTTGIRNANSAIVNGNTPFKSDSPPVISTETRVTSNRDGFLSGCTPTSTSKRRRIGRSKMSTLRSSPSSFLTESTDDDAINTLSFMPRSRAKRAEEFDSGDNPSDVPLVARQRKFQRGTAIIFDEDSSDVGSFANRDMAAVFPAKFTPRNSSDSNDIMSGDLSAGNDGLPVPAAKRKTIGRRLKAESEGGASSRRTRGCYEKPDTVSNEQDNTVLPTPRRNQQSSPGQPASDHHIYSDSADSPHKSRRKQRRTIDVTSGHNKNNERSQPSAFASHLFQKDRDHVSAQDVITIDSDSSDTDNVIVRTPAKRAIPLDEGDHSEDGEPIRSSPSKKRRRITKKAEEGQSNGYLSPRERDRAKSHFPRRLTRQQQPKMTHRTAKQKTMELLRRRRAGEDISELTPSGTDEDEPQQGLYDSDSELPALSNFDDEESESEANLEEVRRTIRAADRNEYDDDFVVADDDEPLGVPNGSWLDQIPLEFTSAAHLPLKDHFKFVVEWMVQRKINPGFNREDPTYVHAFRKIDDEVSGYANSKFMSSAWKEPFTRALRARPEFYEQEISPEAVGESRGCGACGRSKHPATFIVQFGGSAYDKATLDELDNGKDEDDEEDEEDSDVISVNSQDQEIPEASKTWYVGRFCKDNAETAHSLIHWKHALNSWVVDTIKSDGHLEPGKLAQREDWSKKKKNKYAIGIVDGWEAGKQISSLWRDFKNVLEQARTSKPSRFRTSRGL